MITPRPAGVVRVTVSLDPLDVDLIDRLAKAEGSNRSEELRAMLLNLRPMLKATVEAFETASAQRERLDQVVLDAGLQDLEALLPEVEKLRRAYLGAVSRIEGAAAADPRAGNHGGHTPTPPEEQSLS